MALLSGWGLEFCERPSCVSQSIQRFEFYDLIYRLNSQAFLDNFVYQKQNYAKSCTKNRMAVYLTLDIKDSKDWHWCYLEVMSFFIERFREIRIFWSAARNKKHYLKGLVGYLPTNRDGKLIGTVVKQWITTSRARTKLPHGNIKHTGRTQPRQQKHKQERIWTTLGNTNKNPW